MKMKIEFIKNRLALIGSTGLSRIAFAERYINDHFYLAAQKLTAQEISKQPLRSEIINFLIEKLNRPVKYLEIGVRNRKDNFDLINAKEKYSVDPGYESDVNDVDYKMTSDEFFLLLKNGNVLNPQIKFDVIFVDGSHLAEQVERDIENALAYLAEDGFVVMHDCNPPTEFHASETYEFRLSPSGHFWNGTTWKAFVKMRKRTDIFSCCIDSDWGVGIISKKINLGLPNPVANDFYEYKVFENHRKESLNLISYEKLKSLI